MGKWKVNTHAHLFKDITGQRFGSLTVLHFTKRLDIKDSHSHWVCKCDCGKEVTVSGRYLRDGRTVSCGCVRTARVIKMSTTHGQYHTREYHSWASAKSRCFIQSDKKYPDYGGRGITMCAEWHASFQAFIDYMGPRPERSSLDRINNDGNYEPGNCRWATKTTQVRNRRKTIRVIHEGQVISLPELAEIKGVKYDSLKSVFYNHPERFTVPE